ncbi:MAG: response regulator transcription factor [Puniceicoccales bacterium]|jgi:DNA-binding response OmpR family regulator|nr:response regulator transcription factor [Puniceicoccales bacterium]
MAAKVKPLILVVEDDCELSELIEKQLQVSGMDAQKFYNADDALRFLQRSFSNLMLLDFNLPGRNGLSLLEDLKKNSISIPTIFISGENREEIKVASLEAGGDDFLTKPFGISELLSRISAVLRRTSRSGDGQLTANTSLTDGTFDFLGTQVDPARLEIRFSDGSFEKIGRKEFGILSYFAQNPHLILSRRSIIHSVWGEHANVRSRSLDQYVVKLRKLFSAHGIDTEHTIRTSHGIGYTFVPRVKNSTEMPLK